MKKYIPSVVTSGNLICGFAAIQIGDFYWSPILLMCSFIFDGLDGMVARGLQVTSEFGKQMDSLADVISFGVAPSYLYYLLAPDESWECKIIPSVIVVAGTVRLAKFNISPAKKYFQGLPIPANALFYIGIFFALENDSQLFIDFFNSKTNYLLTPIFMSIMMVSFGFRMFSIKGMSRQWKDNIYHYIMAVVVIVISISCKYESISYIVLAYIVLSIINTLTSKYLEKTKIV
ncbi:MAG: CDP-diacylglycerol--serine O-phosphatidyltransferase [Saprospiraceae bacterium]|nr:CDP-diacylglycerol--serine O-phosphatidyltransferase [Saprospiraceae bacterium]